MPYTAAFPKALGTGLLISTPHPITAELRGEMERFIDEYEHALSRFRADSLVAHIGNAEHGGHFDFPDWAGPLFDLYDALHAATRGAIDPCVGEDLIRLGYDPALSFTVEADAGENLLRMDRLDASIKSYPHAEGIEAIMTQTDMTPLQRLAKVLQLGTPSNYRNHTYINGESLYFPTGRVYGGQVIAQSLMAASRTVAPSRLPNSIHGYFISAGDIRQDLLFDVENLRDGRSFSARRVNVTQAQGSILTAIASFQEHDQEGIEFADPMPENIPDPDSLTSAKQLMEPYAEQSPFAKYYAEKSPFDIRHVTRTIMLGADKKSASEDSGKQMVWMKADGKVDVPQVMHRAMLAMGCDQIMLEPILRRAGLSIATPGISYASIDHSMWWYRDIDINQWHLYVQDTPTAAHGRGLGQAKVYTQDGELVACMAQEAMFRVPKKD